MYTQYFQLNEEPFSISANPRFLYLSEQHREALAHLHYGIRMDSGFVMLTGEVGTGKTTVCRCLIEQLPEEANVAFILNPRVSVEELLSSICDEFHIEYSTERATVKTYVDAINKYLLEQNARGRSSVIIVDEAQNLSFEVLEQLRLLTNLETHERKLLRIMLIGQPELEAMLARPELRQLAQRITARYDLKPLSRAELQPYIMHRLTLAGCREAVFPPRLADQIYARSRGIPRLINTICDRAMLGAYSRSQRQVNREIIDEAAREVQGRKGKGKGYGQSFGVAALLLLSLAGGLFALYDSGLLRVPAAFEVQVSSLLDFTKPAGAVADSVQDAGAIENPTTPTQVAMLSGVTSVAEEVVDDGAEVDVEDVTEDIAEVGTEDVAEEVAWEVAEEVTKVVAWPAMVSADNNTVNTALASLFRLWGQPAPRDGENACEQAVGVGLRCYSGIGNLGSVISNNRPAILILRDDIGRSFPAVLRAVEGNDVTIEFAHGVETVSRVELDRRWRGRYQMLWRMPPQGRLVLRQGDRGSSVTWLTSGLRAAGIDSVAITNQYNETVRDAVREFQRSRGLLGDGVAGRQTVIHLNSVADPGVPRLELKEAG